MSSTLTPSLPLDLTQWKCSDSNCGNINVLFSSVCHKCGKPQPWEDTVGYISKICIHQLKDWSHVTLVSNLQVSMLTAALSNRLFKVTLCHNDHKSHFQSHCISNVVVRIFNHDMPISTTQLSHAFQLFGSHDIGVQILANFEIGQIEEFVYAHHINPADLLDTTDKKYYIPIAEILAEIHSMKADPKLFDPKKCIITQRLEKDMPIAYRLMVERCEKEKRDVLFNSIQDMQELWNWLVSTVKNMKDNIGKDIVFCHNDFHAANILHIFKSDHPDSALEHLDHEKNLQNNKNKQQQQQQDGKESEHQKNTSSLKKRPKDEFKIIDYEYSGYTYRCYDIGNFVCELYADNFYDKPPYFRIKKDEMPSKKYLQQFAREYLKHVLGDIKNMDETIDAFLQCVWCGCMMSHFHWGVWGIKQSQRKGVTWNYWEYGIQRFQECFRLKSIFETKSVCFS